MVDGDVTVGRKVVRPDEVYGVVEPLLLIRVDGSQRLCLDRCALIEVGKAAGGAVLGRAVKHDVLPRDVVEGRIVEEPDTTVALAGVVHRAVRAKRVAGNGVPRERQEGEGVVDGTGGAEAQ